MSRMNERAGTTEHHAGAAVSAVVLAPVGVGLGEFVPSLAVRLQGVVVVQLPRHSPADVLIMRNLFEMERVDAVPCATQMVDVMGGWTLMNTQSESVCQHQLAVDADDSVPVSVRGASPQPALVRASTVDSTPEPFFGSFIRPSRHAWSLR